ncbi:hypothetical protein [Mediterraneibacter gnavus]|uniref:hypothetical protein n=1 Tax=Mediterraneibacter gnavus TaxID=33038 RepID=UPI00356A9F06
MRQKDIERFAFLYLCGERDRNILLGKEKMTFSDLDRLTYITDFLDLSHYNLDIWDEFSGQFQKQFRLLDKLYDETCDIVSYDLSECDYRQHELWLIDFCKNAPSDQIRRWLEENIKQICNEKKMDYPTEADTE